MGVLVWRRYPTVIALKYKRIRAQYVVQPEYIITSGTPLLFILNRA